MQHNLKLVVYVFNIFCKKYKNVHICDCYYCCFYFKNNIHSMCLNILIQLNVRVLIQPVLILKCCHGMIFQFLHRPQTQNSIIQLGMFLYLL